MTQRDIYHHSTRVTLYFHDIRTFPLSHQCFHDIPIVTFSHRPVQALPPRQWAAAQCLGTTQGFRNSILRLYGRGDVGRRGVQQPAKYLGNPLQNLHAGGASWTSVGEAAAGAAVAAAAHTEQEEDKGDEAERWLYVPL